uniref:Uncharacterized protein n=1 Tax=Pectinophora gossypiella TaxID=13191 RepID=A0A1E1WDE3_PECGO
MRRNGNRGGPQNRGFSNDRFGNGSLGLQSSSGPLMTDHIQLHAGHHQMEGMRSNLPHTPALLDLDLELELLKRKREIIEKQQTMLLNESRFAPQSNQYNVNRNFSNFYNDAAGSQFDHYDRQQSLKRSAADGWNDGPAPKHYGGPSRSNQAPRRFDTFPKQNARFDQKMGQGPASQPRGQVHRRPTPAHIQNKQNKVAKSKRTPASVPNKLADYPVHERKNLIAQTAPLTSNTRIKKPIEILFLNPNEIPSPKLLGRLELALGNILRELRDQFGTLEEYGEIFRSSTIQRAIKQVLRERIRNVMLNKEVGNCADIVNAYRKQFPTDTDLELITKARDTCKDRNSLVIDLIESADPEKYFKRNFERLLNVSITKLFEKVAKLYESEPSRNKVSAEIMENIIIDLESDPDFIKIEKTEGDDPKKDIVDANKAAETANKDKQTAHEDNETVQKTEKPDQIAETPENGEKAVETVNNVWTAAEEAANISEAMDIAIDESLKARTHIGEPLKAKFFVKLIENMLKKMIPLALPKYKEYMINILNSDEEFKKTKAFLIMTTYKKAEEITDEPNGQSDTAIPGAPPYFVKILGRPTLPNKRLMKKFLDKFNPSMIKKHRVLHNVLYVSFKNKADFDNILTMTGALIASTKLDIRVSENISKRKGEAKQNTPNTSTNSDLLNDSDVPMPEASPDKELDESLDNQITDLLTSIREEEENNQIKNEEENKEIKNEDEIKEEPKQEVKEEVENAKTVEEVKDETQENGDKKENEEENETPSEESTVVSKEVEALKNEGTQGGRATPTRASSRLATATPSTIRTRRASKLAQN